MIALRAVRPCVVVPVPAAGARAISDAQALRGHVAREIGPPCPLCFTGILSFGLVIFQRVFDPREMIADRVLDLRECILDVTTVTAVLRHTSLVAGDLQGLPEPIETFAGQEERIRNKGLAAHLWRLMSLRQRKKRVQSPVFESGYVAVSRCLSSYLFRQAFEWSGAVPTSHTRFREILRRSSAAEWHLLRQQTLRSPDTVVENSPWVTAAYRLVAFIGTYP